MLRYADSDSVQLHSAVQCSECSAVQQRSAVCTCSLANYKNPGLCALGKAGEGWKVDHTDKAMKYYAMLI